MALQVSKAPTQPKISVAPPVKPKTLGPATPAPAQPKLGVRQAAPSPALSVGQAPTSAPLGVPQRPAAKGPSGTLADLGALVKAKYPGAYDNIPDDELGAIVQQKYPGAYDTFGAAAQAVEEQPEEVGFLKSVVQGVAKPFLRLGVSAYNAAAGVNELVKGGNGDGTYSTDFARSRNLGVFGTVDPVKGDSARGLLDAAGTGVELASNFIGAKGATSAGKSLIKGKALQTVAKGAGYGTAQGSVAGLGLGLQDPQAGIKSVVGSTLKGAGTGLLVGGALASIPALPLAAVKGVRNSTRAAQQAFNPEVEAALVRAIKPTNHDEFTKALKTALPDILDTAQHTKTPVDDIIKFENLIKTTKRRVWHSFEQILGPNKAQAIDGNEVADAILASVSKRTRLLKPQLGDRIEAIAEKYRKSITLQDAEEYLEDVNAELSTYFAKNKVGRRIAEADPEISAVIAEGDGLRNALYRKLDELAGAGIDSASIKERYGALMKLAADTAKRKAVYLRQNPESLAEQLTFANALGDIGQAAANGEFGTAVKGVFKATTGRLLKNRNSTDGLIDNAFGKAKKRLGNTR